MKSGKTKLIFSVFCLAAALTLAVFTVYAWFVTFTEVSTRGIDSVITSGDVISFTIDYYYTSSEDGKNFKIGKQIVPDDDDDKIKMPDYTPRFGDNGGTTTAVLVDLKIKFSKTGTFQLTAKTEHSNKPYNEDAEDNDEDFEEYITENYLSNIIFLRKVGSDDGSALPSKEFTVTGNTTEYNFITGYDEDSKSYYNNYFDGENDSSKKNSSVNLPNYTVTEGTTGEQIHHIYYLIDYLTPQINSMYTVMLQFFPKRASLNTQIQFQHDIFFEIGKSDNKN